MSATTFAVGSAEEVLAAVMDARRDGSPLEVRGSGSVLDRLPAGDAAVLSVAGLTGVVAHEAQDLTITVRAATPLAELAAVLAEAGQECPIEPISAIADDPAAAAGAPGTVAGRIATGLAGPRQLGGGRVRDWLLRVRFVTGAGHLAAAGAVTVKDVTGYDICRLLTGSWGTVAVITEVTLKLRPLPRHRGWYAAEGLRHDLDAVLYRPAGVFTSAQRSWALLDGHPDDAAEQAAVAGLSPAAAPVVPDTARVSVDPAQLAALTAELDGLGLTWVAQDGVGVCHVDGDADQLRAVRELAEARGGSLLVLDPGLGLPAFGSRRHRPIAERVRAALDPDSVLAPHRWTR